jgi:hypothetical protein
MNPASSWAPVSTGTGACNEGKQEGNEGNGGLAPHLGEAVTGGGVVVRLPCPGGGLEPPDLEVQMQDLVAMSPRKVAEVAPDKKFRFREAFPSPGVIVVMGERGSGKTSLGMWVMEELHRTKEMGGAVFKAPNAMRKLLPDWVETPTKLSRLPRDSVVVIDEAQGVANARRSSTNENLDLAQCVALSRQRNQLIILISHHSKKLDMLDVMDANRIIWRQPTAGQVMFERKEIQPFSQRALRKFSERKGSARRVAYVMDFQSLTFGFTEAKMPSFWSDGLSIGMAGLGQGFGSGGTLLG